MRKYETVITRREAVLLERYAEMSRDSSVMDLLEDRAENEVRAVTVLESDEIVGTRDENAYYCSVFSVTEDAPVPLEGAIISGGLVGRRNDRCVVTSRDLRSDECGRSCCTLNEEWSIDYGVESHREQKVEAHGEVVE